MKWQPICIDVGYRDYEVGYVQPWSDDPDTFDG